MFHIHRHYKVEKKKKEIKDIYEEKDAGKSQIDHELKDVPS